MNHIVGKGLLLLISTVVNVLAQDKRVLLHSDEDLYQIISSLQRNMAALNASLQAEKTLTASLQAKVAALEANNYNTQPTKGSVYTRWGRTSCPGNGTKMVYKGRMAGSKWDETGGASNHLCLPDDPTWGKYADASQYYDYGSIHGTEIQAPDSVANVLFGKPINSEDVPCAVCRTTRPSNVMIGGRATCYPAWTMEYQGYVISNTHLYKNNADYVCLDAGLEFAPHGATDDNEHVVEIVGAVCGSTGALPCPPYVDGRELACVVCSM